MTRKAFVYLMLMESLINVFAVHAQPANKVFRIGFLSGGFPGPTHWTARLRAELQKIGYVEGQNIVIEARYTRNHINLLPGLADELVRLKPDVIVTGGVNDARAAQRATKAIPIVGLGLGDPIANKFVDSMARPGGNLTGFTTITDELAGKRLEVLKETVANLSRVGVLWNSQFPDTARAAKLYEAAARELSLQIHSINVTTSDQFETAFKEAVRTRSQAITMTAGAFLAANLKRIAEMALKYHLPSIADRDDFVDRGGLMSYGADDAEHFRRVAVFIDKVLKGTKPADIPVEQPMKFEFVINLKTAKQIGLPISPNVLVRADRVIR
jgi:ABC-type uncharacterized transport system substrate-binding protein